MGVAVSGWELASAVARAGQLGVVSGTALDTVLVRRLQLGDPGGHMRRALEAFPYPAMATRIVERYFVEGGLPEGATLAPTRSLSADPSREELELVVAANFVEVYLAQENHDGLVGINYLEKIQTPTLPSIFGAMLAGVDYVLMGAGIPRLIPGILDRLQDGLEVELPLHIVGATEEDHFVARFDPMDLCGGEIPWLNRPKFLAIVSSAPLATMLKRKSDGRVDGFVVEGPTAGGHNAPPRGKMSFNDHGEPVYGERDAVDLEAIAALGLPFWLAGSYGSPEGLRRALETGATGVQVGTAFAFCNESGLRQEIREHVLNECREGRAEVRTDPLASPTGFPFKVLQIDGTMSDDSICDQRNRICDLGYLQQGYRKEDGTIGWRCPGEPIKSYVAKGGNLEDCAGRKCVCNCLLANVGMQQFRRNGYEEKVLVTCGADVNTLVQFLRSADQNSYSAVDVIYHLLSGVAANSPSLAG